jgi:hypothetical protein
LAVDGIATLWQHSTLTVFDGIYERYRDDVIQTFELAHDQRAVGEGTGW